MSNSTTTTKPVWVINEKDKKDWLKKHQSDTILKKKFKKFEKSVSADPTSSNPHVKKLKGEMDDVHEYKVPPVRGLYIIDATNTELGLIDFDYKGNIVYRK